MNKKVALYMRLSQEDDKDSLSASILSQRSILKDYILNNESLLVFEQVEFIDDGYSGYNFERPAISSLIEMVRAGEIYCIIVKDISRFGRNHLEVLPYIDKIFPFMGVRFISVTDGLDTFKKIDTNTAIDVSIKSMIHEFYLKDLSKKMKSSNKINAKKGKNTSTDKVFGYIKDYDNKHKIVIDEEAAGIVRMIFQYAYEGKKINEIAILLNNNNVETPLKYWLRKGINNSVVARYKKSMNEDIVNTVDEKHISNYWTYYNVSRTLKNEVYIGTFVAYKRECVEIKSKKSVKKDENEWIKVENTHEPIIEKEMFYAVQEKLFSTKATQREYTKPHIFSRKIYCGKCGRVMYITGRNKNGFQCCGKRYTNEEKCFAKPIQKVDVESIVFATVKDFVNTRTLKDRDNVIIKDINIKDEVYEKLVNQNKKEIEKLNHESKKLFEKYMNGKVTEKYFQTENIRINELKKSFEVDIAPKEVKLKVSDAFNENRLFNIDNVGHIDVNEEELLNKISESDRFIEDMVKFVKRVLVYSMDRIEVELNTN